MMWQRITRLIFEVATYIIYRWQANGGRVLPPGNPQGWHPQEIIRVPMGRCKGPPPQAQSRPGCPGNVAVAAPEGHLHDSH